MTYIYYFMAVEIAWNVSDMVFWIADPLNYPVKSDIDFNLFYKM